MPTLKELDSLKTHVNQLGDEPQIRESRGETIPDIKPLDSPKIETPPPVEEPPDGGGIDEMEALLNAYSSEMDNLEQSDTDPWPDEPEEEQAVSTPIPAIEIPSEESPPATDELPLPDEGTESAVAEPSEYSTEQFSLDDFGDEYKFNYDDTKLGENIDIDDIERIGVEVADPMEFGEEESLFALEEEDFVALQEALQGFPHNLKLAIESYLADSRRDEATLQKLLKAILAGESPRGIAKLYYSITKRRIELPRSYMKLSGKTFEDIQAKLFYQLIERIWPILRLSLSAILGIWISGMVLFMWLYRPLKAESLYKKGLEHIVADEVENAVESFSSAWNGWPLFSNSNGEDAVTDASIVVKGWQDKKRWLVYARIFRQRKYFEMAEKFYEGYLTAKPNSIEGRIEYGIFLSSVLGDYERAIAILEAIPEREELLLASGDVYLEWAEEDSSKYEEARLRYAKALERSRSNEQAILSMMHYHLKTQNSKEIQTLLPTFLTKTTEGSAVPELASKVYAGLAEFHLSRDLTREAMHFIDLAEATAPHAPEPFFIKALYWKRIGDAQKERENYRQTLAKLDGKEFMSRNDIRMRILSMGGIGRYYADIANHDSTQPQDVKTQRLAMHNYGKAISLYHDAISRSQIAPSSVYGSLFIEAGNLVYQQEKEKIGENSLSLIPKEELFDSGNTENSPLRQAEQYYTQAEKLLNRGNNRSGLPDRALYRRAYIRYRLKMEDALIDFHRVSRRRPDNYDARLALATVLLKNGDYEAARIQYARSIELMDWELAATGAMLEIDKRTAHDELLIRYVSAWNNLGVGRALSAAREGNDEDYGAALSAFTAASDYLDRVYSTMTSLASRGAAGMRDQDDYRIIERSGNLNFLKEKATFPYQNRLHLLGKEDVNNEEFGYLIYSDIPSDLWM